MPLFSLHRARSNVDELYYEDNAAKGRSEPATAPVIAVPTEEPAAEEPASGGMPLFSLHRARSNVDELYYENDAEAGASEPASMSTTTAAAPTAEPAAEEPASGGMPLFSLHRARSNVDELY